MVSVGFGSLAQSKSSCLPGPRMSLAWSFMQGCISPYNPPCHTCGSPRTSSYLLPQACGLMLPLKRPLCNAREANPALASPCVLGGIQGEQQMTPFSLLACLGFGENQTMLSNTEIRS